MAHPSPVHQPTRSLTYEIQYALPPRSSFTLRGGIPNRQLSPTDLPKVGSAYDLDIAPGAIFTEEDLVGPSFATEIGKTSYQYLELGTEDGPHPSSWPGMDRFQYV